MISCCKDNGPDVVVGLVAFLCVAVLLLVLSLTISKMWTVVIFMFIMILIGFLLFALGLQAAFVYEIVVSMTDGQISHFQLCTHT